MQHIWKVHKLQKSCPKSLDVLEITEATESFSVSWEYSQSSPWPGPWPWPWPACWEYSCCWCCECGCCCICCCICRSCCFMYNYTAHHEACVDVLQEVEPRLQLLLPQLPSLGWSRELRLVLKTEVTLQYLSGLGRHMHGHRQT